MKKIEKEKNDKCILYFHTKENKGDVFLDTHLTFFKLKLKTLLYDYRFKKGFKIISTPILNRVTLFDMSGHTKFFNENMFYTDDGKTVLKPMSCPCHALYVKNTFQKNFNRFPLKLFEFGKVFRKENSGNIANLERLQTFTQDDSHIFVINQQQTYDTIKELVIETCNFYSILYKRKPEIFVSTQPGITGGLSESETTLIRLLDELKLQFKIDNGEGAFYGPKIDFKINGTQLSTIQLDLELAKKFDLFFLIKGEKTFPIVIHFALLGSLERFIKKLLTEFEEEIPVWGFKVPILWNGRIDNKIIFDNIEKLLGKKIHTINDKNVGRVNVDFDYVKYIVTVLEKEKKGFITLKNNFSKKIITMNLEEFQLLIKEEVKIIDFFNSK